MKAINRKSKIKILWKIWRGVNKISEDFSSPNANLKVFLVGSCDTYAMGHVINREVEPGYDVIEIDVYPNMLAEGVYDLKALWTKNEERNVLTSERSGVFGITDSVEEAEVKDEEVRLVSMVESYGRDGMSAYETAVLHGVNMGVTSEKEWASVLRSYNCYFLIYKDSKEETRLQVPIYLRREGLMISYVTKDRDVIIEYYNASDIKDDAFRDSGNWREGNNRLVGDLSISSNGNWVINGVETSFKAQGNDGDTPLLRYDNGYIQYSYNGKVWYNIVDKSELTPDIKVGAVTTLSAGSKASVTKSGTNTNPVLDFKIPMGNTGAKGEKGDGWQLKGFVDSVDALPSSGSVGDLYLVGTSEPYDAYVYKNSTSKFVNIGNALEVKASIFDGGRADTLYGGARVINCGGADAYLTY